jgi:hypothetical protein
VINTPGSQIPGVFGTSNRGLKKLSVEKKTREKDSPVY